MPQHAIDIIVPVWNRPIETRNCLVSLIQHSKGARFVLVDNGSDRETEILLEEFAERLDDRALLLRTECNQGYIKAVNRGLARAEAPLIVVVRPTTLVSAGWLEPLVEFAGSNAEAGIIIPRLVEAGSKKMGGRPAAVVQEVTHGSLAAMLIRKELYDRIGGFDELLDGGVWCLKDYSRQAYLHGYLTYAVAGGLVSFVDEVPLGSVERRRELVEQSRKFFLAKWGEDAAYCIYIPKEMDYSSVQQKLRIVLLGARQGYRFTIIAAGSLCRLLQKNGGMPIHESITLLPLPMFGGEKGARKRFEQLLQADAAIIPVAGVDGIDFPGLPEALPFRELEDIITAQVDNAAQNCAMIAACTS